MVSQGEWACKSHQITGVGLLHILGVHESGIVGITIKSIRHECTIYDADMGNRFVDDLVAKLSTF